jgi:spermidine/putrescine transport system permease protein
MSHTQTTSRKRGKLVNLRNFPGFNPTAWFVLFFLYSPLVYVIIYSFNSSRIGAVWESFSVKWYGRVFENTDIQRALKNSLQVGFVATVLSTILAVMAALGLLRMQRAGKAVAMALIGAPLIIAEIVLAVGTLGLFIAVGVPLGKIGLMVAHTAFCIPFALLPIRARLSQLDMAPFEAASDLGANERQILRRITLPLLAPAIFAGALLAFAISIDDFITSFFVAGPGATTLPVYIFGMIRSTVTPEVNAISTLLLLFSGSVLIGYRASQSFEVVILNAAKAGEIVDAVVASAGDSLAVNGVTPFVYDNTKATEAARNSAVKNAKAKAASYAKLLGVKIGKIIYLEESSAPSSYPIAMAQAKASDEATQIDLGQQDVSVSVATRWAIS